MSFDLTEYFKTFGHDIEEEERREKAHAQQVMDRWFQTCRDALCRWYDQVLAAAEALAPGDKALPALAGRTFLYNLLAGAVQGDAWGEELVLGGGQAVSRYAYAPCRQLLRLFLEARPGLCTDVQAARAVDAGAPLFAPEGEVSGQVCGLFWQHLLAALPPCTQTARAQPPVADLFDGLSRCFHLFRGDPENSCRWDTLQEAFFRHWEVYTAAHPDRTAAQAAVAQWEFSQQPMACRDLVLAAFPQAAGPWIPEELTGLDLPDLFGVLYPQDPALVLAMWRLLLDTAPLEDPEAAEYLLYDAMELVWLAGEATSLSPILQALAAEPAFARQVFLAPYTGLPQQTLLDHCRDPQARRTFLSLLADNPRWKG